MGGAKGFANKIIVSDLPSAGNEKGLE